MPEPRRLDPRLQPPARWALECSATATPVTPVAIAPTTAIAVTVVEPKALLRDIQFDSDLSLN